MRQQIDAENRVAQASLDDWREVLGRAAVAVWVAMLPARDPETGENWMLRRTLARMTGRPEWAVHEALRRLARVGLVKRGKRRRWGQTWVATRVVLGTWRVDTDGTPRIDDIPERVMFTYMKGKASHPTYWEQDNTLSTPSLPSEAKVTAGGGIVPSMHDAPIVFALSAKLAVPGIPSRPVLRPARVPSPSPLPADADDAAEMVANLYADLRRVRFGARFGWRGPLRRQGWWKVLRAGVAELRERGWCPAAWLGWVFGLWGGKGAPPLAWALAPARMAEREAWFCSESNGVACGGRMLPSAAGDELWRRWRAMADALYRIGPATPNTLREVAAQHLTPDDAARLTAEATREAEVQTKLVQAELKKGRWLWQ